MIIKETIDPDEIKRVLCHPEIYPCITSDDECPDLEDFEPPMDAEYIGGYVGCDIIGIMVYHTYKDGFECHIQVLPEYRKEYAREFAQMALEIGKAKNASIYAEIPDCYPNVLKFAKSFGFNETGSIEDGYTRNGMTCDVTTLRLEHGIH